MGPPCKFKYPGKYTKYLKNQRERKQKQRQKRNKAAFDTKVNKAILQRTATLQKQLEKAIMAKNTNMRDKQKAEQKYETYYKRNADMEIQQKFYRRHIREQASVIAHLEHCLNVQ